MELQALGYVGVGTSKPEDWSAFATSMLGMQLSETSVAGQVFRMDDRKQRMFVDGNHSAPPHTFGWEVTDAAALDRLATRLEEARVTFLHEPSTLADRRCVRDLISFNDPMGNRLEAFWGAAIDEQPFVPGRSISGFRTGPLGLGHVVLMTRDLPAARHFYEVVLGFQLTDYIVVPFTAYFFHINSRHHSLALIEHEKDGVHHLMAEYFMMDDVGQAYDIALNRDAGVGVTLGRHANDFMISFYANSPSGFLFECGWGGISVDVSTWVASECKPGPSIWGHERDWLPPTLRAGARHLRMAAAAGGSREPVHVMDGNYSVMRK